jgi:hypothetical protein
MPTRIFVAMTPIEMAASRGRPTATRATPNTKMTVLTNVRMFSRAICP